MPEQRCKCGTDAMGGCRVHNVHRCRELEAEVAALKAKLGQEEVSDIPDGVLRVTFDVSVGDTWTDPEGQQWQVVGIDVSDVLVERVETHEHRLPATTMARQWRKAGAHDTHPASAQTGEGGDRG